MRRILFYDTETSGIPDWDLPADHPSQPHIVDLAGVLCNMSTGEELARFEGIVRPEGWTIPPELAEIHGITNEIAQRVGKPIAEVLDGFEALVGRAHVLAAYHLRFEEKMLRSERRRLGRPDGFGKVPVFCCMKGARPLCALPKGKVPRLGEAVKLLLGRDHAGAHRAIVDAIAARDIFFACRENPVFMEKGRSFATNQARAYP